jgi:hypothetical protein
MASFAQNFFAGRQAALAERQAEQDNARAENAFAMQRERFGMEKQQFQQGEQERESAGKRQSLERVGAIAKRALSITDPAGRKGFLQQTIGAYGDDFAALGSDTSQLPKMLELPDDQLTTMLQQASQFAPAGEAYTLAPGAKRFVGNTEVAANPDTSGEGGFTLSPGQERRDASGRLIARADKAAPTKPELFDVASKLRGEYNSQSKEFVGVANAYQRIKDSSTDPSAAGDLALIFNYMKVLDPGSTVREGEFATAQNAGSVPARIWAQYNKIMSGERLAPDQRNDFVSRATKLYQGAEARWDSGIKTRYESLAKRYGLDPAEVLSDPRAGLAPGQVPQFATEADAERAGLKPGTRVVIGGVAGTWQ